MLLDLRPALVGPYRKAIHSDLPSRHRQRLLLTEIVPRQTAKPAHHSSAGRLATGLNDFTQGKVRRITGVGRGNDFTRVAGARWFMHFTPFAGPQ